jgi:alpha-ketoglutarate-dependent 2,4-dichlorophenoxyacetate dioxygenase
MALSVRPLHPTFGAEVDGVSIAGDPGAGSALRELVTRFGVVFLHGQVPSDEQLEAFGGHLGELFAASGWQSMNSRGKPVFHLSNIDENGSILAETDKRRTISLANMLWHTDGTYTKPRQEISVLYGHRVPSSGGDTQFCDMRVAFEALGDDERQVFESLTVKHSIIHSRALTGFSDWTQAEVEALPPLERPLVHLHRESGRRALGLASHICEVSGHSKEAGQALVDRLTEQARLEDRVYTHRWAAGDVLLWDNRCTMHRGRSYDSFNEVRDLRSLRTYDNVDP